MDLSIVIPAFNEDAKISADILAASDFLVENSLAGQIIISDDGSTDHTAQKAQSTPTPSQVQLKIIRSQTQKGKGHAVRSAMLAAEGKYAMFADSGCCVPYNNALVGLKMLKTGQCDIACGSRWTSQSNIIQNQPFHRRLYSKIFRYFARTIMKIPAEITDTQCGFKIFKGEIAKQLFSQSIIDGFMFDIEIILLAIRKGYKVKQFPVKWSCDIDSRLSAKRNAAEIVSELITIKRNLKTQDSAD